MLVYRYWLPLACVCPDQATVWWCEWPVPSGGAPYQNKSSWCLQFTALVSCCQAFSIVACRNTNSTGMTVRAAIIVYQGKTLRYTSNTTDTANQQKDYSANNTSALFSECHNCITLGHYCLCRLVNTCA